MFGIGFGEMLIIGVILLLAVGPKELPKLMKTVGKGMREVRKASDDLRKTVGIDQLLADDDLKNPLKNDMPARRMLGVAELEREVPPHGVDLAHAAIRAQEAARVAQSVPAAPASNVEAGPRTGEQNGHEA